MGDSVASQCPGHDFRYTQHWNFATDPEPFLGSGTLVAHHLRCGRPDDSLEMTFSRHKIAVVSLGRSIQPRRAEVALESRWSQLRRSVGQMHHENRRMGGFQVLEVSRITNPCRTAFGGHASTRYKAGHSWLSSEPYPPLLRINLNAAEEQNRD